MPPEGWIKTSFEEHIDLLSGQAFKSAQYTTQPKDIRLLRGDNIEPSSLRWRDAKRWSINDVEAYKKYELKTGDLVIAMDRTWVSAGLKVAEVKSHDVPCLLVQRVARIRARKTFLQSLLIQYFTSHRFHQYVMSVQTETAVPHISATQIKDFPLLLPPLPEQRKIAKILQTWDRAIATTEKLIDASKQQKKALMQQLLTGKKRFAGFEGEWERKRLSEISQVIVSPVDKKTFPNEMPIELCNYTDVYYRNYITHDVAFMRATATPAEIRKYTVQQGDVIVTKDSETAGDIAVPAFVSDKLDGVVCGYHLAIIRPDSSITDGSYLSHLFSMQITRYYFFRLATGATRFGLSVGAINNAEFYMPEIQEQIRVSKVLTTIDKEIESLKSKVKYLKQEKKALMQQLLTGKRRVKVDAQ